MRKIISLIMLFVLGFSFVSVNAAPLREINYELKERAVDFSFDFDGADYLVLSYRTVQESGQFLISGENGKFTGTINLPNTYPGNMVTINIQTTGGRSVLEKYQIRTLVPVYAPAQRAEEGALKGVKICVDPGHQGVGIGLGEPLGPGLSGSKTTHNGQAQGVLTRRMESVVVLEIGQKLRDALLKCGAEVIMTRSDQETAVSNQERAEIANRAEADICFRLHCNLTSNENTTGIVIYMPLNSDYAKEVSDRESYKALGEALLSAMQNTTQVQRGSVAQNDQFVGNNWSKMPCFLIEMGYMSNPLEDLLLSDEAYQQKLVDGMVQGAIEIARLRGLIK